METSIPSQLPTPPCLRARLVPLLEVHSSLGLGDAPVGRMVPAVVSGIETWRAMACRQRREWWLVACLLGWLVGVLGKYVEKQSVLLIFSHKIIESHRNIDNYEDPTGFGGEDHGRSLRKSGLLQLRIQANKLRVELDTTNRNTKKTYEKWQVELGGYNQMV